jgi:phosphinothricin acetyltransferase
VGVYPHSGFKLGRWLDVGWWWLPLRDPPGQPREPAEWDGLG